MQDRHFNSQPHEEADKRPQECEILFFLFQLTASRRGWPIYCKWLTVFSYFNSQPHEEADGIIPFWFQFPTTFQLTASRRGWRLTVCTEVMEHDISTHSLTKRLTIWLSAERTSCWEFQLTASRRGWPSVSMCQYYLYIFQLTASRRGWHVDVLASAFNMDISTHSLTKRLTTTIIGIGYVELFQLTASRRGWLTSSKPLRALSAFQLTASRRGWLLQLSELDMLNYFNSQPHEEADGQCTHRSQNGWHFNSQPHEEADKIILCVCVQFFYFNSQPHEEAD